MTQTLYKAQLTDLREDFEEKRRQNLELEEERNELTRQLQASIARADSESLAKSISHETIAELEKEKTMRELEIKDLLARHKTEVSNKDIVLNSVRFSELMNIMILSKFHGFYIILMELMSFSRSCETRNLIIEKQWNS